MKTNASLSASTRVFMLMVLSLGAVFAAPSMAKASAPVCSEIFSAPTVAFGLINVNFNHKRTYSNEVKDQAKIKNQCGLGTCTLHAWSTAAENAYARRTKGSLEIATDYLAARHWLETSMNVLHSADSNNRVGLSMTITAARENILKYGIIPMSAWIPGPDFKINPVAGRLQSYVSNIIGQAKWARDRESRPEVQKQIIAEADSEIRMLFQNAFGKFPERFEYNGLDYSPREFAYYVMPELALPVDRIFVQSKANEATRVYNEGSSKTIETSAEQTAQTLRELIDRDQTVYLAYDHEPSFVDVTTGIMSISAFNMTKNSAPLSREQRRHYDRRRNKGHAVAVVGYDADPVTGRIIKFKIQNSWGEKSGDKGVYHMYLDYFLTFANAISFYSDSGVRLPR